jgi:hypothetical protein
MFSSYSKNAKNAVALLTILTILTILAIFNNFDNNFKTNHPHHINLSYNNRKSGLNLALFYSQTRCKISGRSEFFTVTAFSPFH